MIGQVTEALTGDKLVFAYTLSGLFMGYVYFSIPRTILTVMAAAESSTRNWRKLPVRWAPRPGGSCWMLSFPA